MSKSDLPFPAVAHSLPAGEAAFSSGRAALPVVGLSPHDVMIFGVIFALMAFVFVFDMLTPPDDVSVAFLYTVPVFVTIFSTRKSSYSFALLATILAGLGAFIQTPGDGLDLVFVANRVIACVAHWLVAFFVTARTQSEALMHLNYEEGQRELETNRRFMDVLSHEIGTSLTTIQGHAFRLRKLAENNEPLDVVARAEKIGEAVNHIEAVVRQVQLASEVGQGAVALRPVATSLPAIVQEAVHQVQSRRVLTDVSALPESVWADGDMLLQVMINLLSNAIKYSLPETPVHVTGHTDQGHAVLTVIDRGRGVPADEIPKLWAPYYRARNSHGVHGTGIGLYVAKRFVEMHGGTIDFNSELNRGTTVSVRIPIGHPPIPEQAHEPGAHPMH